MGTATVPRASTTGTTTTTIPIIKPTIKPLPEGPESTTPATARAATTKALRRISQHPNLTPYRRRVYRTLLSIPPSRWTTYAALAKHLNSSARAVGGAMRGNPFAPEVPCHRVLGSGGIIGGYKGAWKSDSPRSVAGSGDGETTGETTGDEKRRMLEMEGVVFDAAGRAKGECFGGFRDLGDAHCMNEKEKREANENDELQ